MATGPRYKVQFRRRRTGQTDYGRRRNLLQGRTTRLVVRGSNRAITVQFVDYAAEGDVVRAVANSRDLGSSGWTRSFKSTPAAYLTGVLAAIRAKKAGVTNAVLDTGRFKPATGSRTYAALKGVVDAGIQVPHTKEGLPKQERIVGQHLKDAPVTLFKDTLTKLQAGA